MKIVIESTKVFAYVFKNIKMWIPEIKIANNGVDKDLCQNCFQTWFFDLYIIYVICVIYNI